MLCAKQKVYPRTVKVCTDHHNTHTNREKTQVVTSKSKDEIITQAPTLRLYYRKHWKKVFSRHMNKI